MGNTHRVVINALRQINCVINTEKLTAVIFFVLVTMETFESTIVVIYLPGRHGKPPESPNTIIELFNVKAALGARA